MTKFLEKLSVTPETQTKNTVDLKKKTLWTTKLDTSRLIEVMFGTAEMRHKFVLFKQSLTRNIDKKQIGMHALQGQCTRFPGRSFTQDTVTQCEMSIGLSVKSMSKLPRRYSIGIWFPFEKDMTNEMDDLIHET